MTLCIRRGVFTPQGEDGALGSSVLEDQAAETAEILTNKGKGKVLNDWTGSGFKENRATQKVVCGLIAKFF